MTDLQKTCIEYMVLGQMDIEDACILCNCTEADFETPECKAYTKQYGDEFDAYIDYMKGLEIASIWRMEYEYKMSISMGYSPYEALREWDLL